MVKYTLKVIVEGSDNLEGEILVFNHPISFLGDFDPKTGEVKDPNSPHHGKTVKEKIIAIPAGRGSTVGSYIIYAMAKNGTAPKAILAGKAEPIIITGAVISNLPLAEGLPKEFFRHPRTIKGVYNAKTGELNTEE
ncbi:MAG: DUF126 domain-containing protein [Desulfurococcales archaeon]|nr:DUF126 domain-containing protein [Desulfurococcales archaeon]